MIYPTLLACALMTSGSVNCVQINITTEFKTEVECQSTARVIGISIFDALSARPETMSVAPVRGWCENDHPDLSNGKPDEIGFAVIEKSVDDYKIGVPL